MKIRVSKAGGQVLMKLTGEDGRGGRQRVHTSLVVLSLMFVVPISLLLTKRQKMLLLRIF